MSRVYNFSAGPSMLPERVLRQAAYEILDCGGCGQSVMEMSHRSEEFDEIFYSTKERMRRLLKINDSYEVLFLQGGASTQFAAVPMNLMVHNGKADYVLSGNFSEKACREAEKYGDVKIVGSSKECGYAKIPTLRKRDFRGDADYFHICLNNTIFGTEWKKLPDTGNVPLVADASSYILSRPMDVGKFGVIYAGAQKNAAPAGLTIVIIRKDLIGEPMSFTPTVLSYKVMSESDSRYNTPPCWCIYICGLVLKWIEAEMGGLEGIEEINREKAGLLYDFLESSKLFKGCADRGCRSLTNVTFTSGDRATDESFIKGAGKVGLVNLNGHRSVGGMRASIYNAMPKEGVERLVEFMRKFEKENL